MADYNILVQPILVGTHMPHKAYRVCIFCLDPSPLWTNDSCIILSLGVQLKVFTASLKTKNKIQPTTLEDKF
jgi:hypothetical protein